MDIRNLNNYINKQTNFRDGISVVIPLTPEQEKAFEEYLKNYDKNNDYWFPGNVCTDPTNDGLKNLGLNFNSQTAPMSLYLELIRAGIVKQPTYIKGRK